MIERTKRIKELISGQVDVGTFRLVELELLELELLEMEEIINKIFKEYYPNGLSAEYTKEEMVGYMMAINDIKEQLSN